MPELKKPQFDELRWLVLDCGSLNSTFSWEVAKLLRRDRSLQESTAVATTLLTERVWSLVCLSREEDMPSGILEICTSTRKLIDKAVARRDLASDQLDHIAWSLVSCCNMLPRPHHDLFWLGYAIGAFASWCAMFKDLALMAVTKGYEEPARRLINAFPAGPVDPADELIKLVGESRRSLTRYFSAALLQRAFRAMSTKVLTPDHMKTASQEGIRTDTVFKDFFDMHAKLDLSASEDDPKTAKHNAKCHNKMVECAEEIRRRLACCYPRLEAG